MYELSWKKSALFSFIWCAIIFGMLGLFVLYHQHIFIFLDVVLTWFKSSVWTMLSVTALAFWGGLTLWLRSMSSVDLSP